MASVLNSKAKFYSCDSYGNEIFNQEIQSEADIYIKKLSQNQLNTNVNLQKCLQTEKSFERSHTYKPVTESSTGTLSYEDYKELTAKLDERVEYASNGDDDSDPTKKNISRHVRELAFAVKPNSLETKLLQFAISCNAVGETRTDIRPPEHPINQLDKIESELFGHLSQSNDPNKTAKTILRKRRQLLEAVSDPIGVSGFSSPEKIPERIENKSLWDIADPIPVKKKSSKKVYSCNTEKLFTIKDGTIVELKKENDLKRKPTTEDKSLPFISIDTDTEKPQESHRRLTEEEIRKIPKFLNYDKGTPSNILYLKNLSSLVNEKDLVSLFSKYQEPNQPRIIYKLMQKGKMRGQAFIHFSSVESSVLAMEEINGVVLYDKPIIIHFGRTKI